MRNLLKRIIPHPHTVREHRHLRFLPRDILHDPDIFHLTRRSTAGGVAAGLFAAFIPFPGHFLYAALLAIFFRVNLPLAFLCSLVTNPLTIPPFFYLAYRIGALMLGMPPHPVEFELSLAWFKNGFLDIWEPLLLGSLICATVAALIGYFAVRLIWWLYVSRRWALRRRGRRQS